MGKYKFINFGGNKGFTLIEMMISLAIFLLISGAAVGIFISVTQRQKEVLAEQELLNQISYAQEYMSRALRMAKASTSNIDIGCIPLGDIYLLTRPESNFYNGIKFLNQSDADAAGNAMCEEFYLDDKTDADHPVLKMQKGIDNPVALTSSDMKIKSIRFVVLGANGLDGSSAGCASQDNCAATNHDTPAHQPRVTILLNVEFAGQPAETIQTTVSQRNLNVNAQPE
jgi:prepilin-type N-terminal cleavage/methylation domain-containing protein